MMDWIIASDAFHLASSY